jgi:Tfp pilus assembly protein PilX
MRSAKRQSGAVLFVTLIMLTVMTLFGLSVLNMQTTEWRVIGNIQAKQRLQADVQQALEDVLSAADYFSAPAGRSVTVNGTSITIGAPVCSGVALVTGYSAVASVAVYESAWTIEASATDTATGAATRISQGVRVRSVSGDCP